MPDTKPRLLAVTLCLCMICGCESHEPIVSAGEIQKLSRIPYPLDAPLGDDLDVTVTQRGADIELTNRTAYRFRDVLVWVNQQYLGFVEDIPVGQSVSVPLRRFVNKHRESFPLGGFLTPEKTRPVVLVEIIGTSGEGGVLPPDPLDSDPNELKRYRLLVRRD